MRIPFTPIRRIIFGFGLCVIQMVICAILQWRCVHRPSQMRGASLTSLLCSRVYETSPCGYYATECLDAEGNARVST
jgi:hypothetical protein